MLAREMGDLLSRSHRATMQYGFNHPPAEQLIQHLEAAGPEKGILGTRLTMGGNGSTVCALTWEAQGQETALRIFQAFERQHQIRGYFLGGSSEGAFFRQP